MVGKGQETIRRSSLRLRSIPGGTSSLDPPTSLSCSFGSVLGSECSVIEPFGKQVGDKVSKYILTEKEKTQ